jgi:hypothetical protein
MALFGSDPCLDNLSTDLTATYKDSAGVARTLNYSAGDLAGGSVTGAYSATSVSVDVHFRNCDPNRSASCDVTLTASPK